MTIKSVSDISAAYDAGRSWTGYLRKSVSTLANTGCGTDMSYLAGLPVANYYAATPAASAVLTYNDGIYAGPWVGNSGHTKYLHKITYLPPSNVTYGQATLYFHDIVMFYPFVDGDGGYQELTNNVPIPRYGGENCKIMMIVQGTGSGSSTNTYVTYTNTKGIQKTVRMYANGSTNAGFAANIVDLWGLSAGSPFQTPVGQPYLALAQGDTGVRSIDAIDFRDPIGGIYALVIVKPLASISMQDQTAATGGTLGAPIEVDFARDRFSLPEVADGANIYPFIRATVAGSGTINLAELSFIWG